MYFFISTAVFELSRITLIIMANCDVSSTREYSDKGKVLSQGGYPVSVSYTHLTLPTIA